MKIAGIILFVLLTTLFYSGSVQAQINLLNSNDLSTINIDDYSDNDLSSMLNRATASGISESQIYRLVAERGLPESEVSKLQQQTAIHC